MILLYHNIIPRCAPSGQKALAITLMQSAFREQIRFLKGLFDLVSMDDYLACKLYTKKPKKRLMTITIDDCTSVTFDNVLPIISGYNIPVTFFVATSQIDNGPLIPGAYINALCYERIYPDVLFEGTNYSLRTLSDINLSREKILGKINLNPHAEETIKYLEKKYPIPQEIRTFYAGMTTGQLQQASRNEFVTIGSHTINHPRLSVLSSVEQSKELRESKGMLERIIGKEVKYIAYPSGDYSIETIIEAKRAGYEAGFAVHQKKLPGIEQRYELPRLGIYSPSLFRMCVKLFCNHAK